MFNQRGQIAENKNVKFLIAAIFPKNKKGQISETMTWVVATTAIIVVLILSISIVNLGFKEKSFSAQGGYSDLLVTKSFMGYLLTDGNKVYNDVQSNQKLTDYTGNLALDVFDIFKDSYYYSEIWFGVDSETQLLVKNDYFKSKPRLKKGGDIPLGYKDFVSEKIKLNEDKYLELFLVKK